MSLTAAVLRGFGGMIGTDASHLTVLLLWAGLPVVMTWVNFVGSKSVRNAGSVIVGLNVAILLVSTALALIRMNLELLSPSTRASNEGAGGTKP